MRLRDSRAWRAFKRFSQVIATVQARIILGVIYFVVLLPFAIFSRIGSCPFKPSGWTKRNDSQQHTRESALKQS